MSCMPTMGQEGKEEKEQGRTEREFWKVYCCCKLNIFNKDLSFSECTLEMNATLSFLEN